MKRRAQWTWARAAWAAGLALLGSSYATAAWACPMCFSGGNTNQDAFLYGSLFLMVVPVTAIGGLVYLGYRRARALDEAECPRARAMQVAEAEPAGQLHIAPR